MECHLGGLTHNTYATLEAPILGIWCQKMQEESLMVLGWNTDSGLVCLLDCNPNDIIIDSATPLICVRHVTHTWATVSFDSFLQDAASYFKRVFLYTYGSALAFFLSISILQVMIIVMQLQVNHPVEKVQMHRQHHACHLWNQCRMDRHHQAWYLIYVPYSLVGAEIALTYICKRAWLLLPCSWLDSCK